MLRPILIFSPLNNNTLRIGSALFRGLLEKNPILYWIKLLQKLMPKNWLYFLNFKSIPCQSIVGDDPFRYNLLMYSSRSKNRIWVKIRKKSYTFRFLCKTSQHYGHDQNGKSDDISTPSNSSIIFLSQKNVRKLKNPSSKWLKRNEEKLFPVRFWV